MTTIEHLQRIKSRCQELLATAEKRTPGRWVIHPSRQWPLVSPENYTEPPVAKVDCSISDQNRPYEEASANATFIASCAGPAEAGWRATIAAVEGLLRVYQRCDEPTSTYAEETLAAIIAAWPEEALA